MSPMLWAAVGGMAAFAASSMVSSFSFRVVQNGAAFFIVFAIALNEAARSTREKRTVSSNRTVNIAAAAAALLSVAYFGSKAYAEDLVYLSERTSDTGAAHRLYKTSIRVDPDNANARYSYSYRLFSSNEPGAAAAELRSAIDRGLGVTITYTTLSKYFEAAEQRQDAESVYREALSIFPNSVYLRVSYACFLERNGRPEESRSELLFARNISGPQANGWYELIIHGSVAAYLAAQKNPDYTAPADLLPANAVSQYVDDPLDPKPLAPPAATR
ncbi:MAG: hypothetical protein JO053_08530 [Acidobacteria bacterium]|nr:hypothetical protein [Acidobacteriota bacterium]